MASRVISRRYLPRAMWLRYKVYRKMNFASNDKSINGAVKYHALLLNVINFSMSVLWTCINLLRGISSARITIVTYGMIRSPSSKLLREARENHAFKVKFYAHIWTQFGELNPFLKSCMQCVLYI